jgi:hypothetical protein
LWAWSQLITQLYHILPPIIQRPRLSIITSCPGVESYQIIATSTDVKSVASMRAWSQLITQLYQAQSICTVVAGIWINSTSCGSIIYLLVRILEDRTGPDRIIARKYSNDLISRRSFKLNHQSTVRPTSQISLRISRSIKAVVYKFL